MRIPSMCFCTYVWGYTFTQMRVAQGSWCVRCYRADSYTVNITSVWVPCEFSVASGVPIFVGCNPTADTGAFIVDLVRAFPWSRFPLASPSVSSECSKHGWSDFSVAR